MPWLEHELEGCIVDAREIERSARLVLLRAQAERVHPDPVVVRHARMVLVRLAEPEVRPVPRAETFVPIELQVDLIDRAVVVVLVDEPIDRVLAQLLGLLEPMAVVKRVGLLRIGDIGLRIIARSFWVGHFGRPVDGLGRVVEVQGHRKGRVRSRIDLIRHFCASVLQLLDQILVRHLGEPSPLVRVQIKEVRVQLGHRVHL
eukprot:6192192-Pleurochrysis_carterae.AAC.1